MRKLVCILVASLYATIASAYLLENEDFDLGGASWGVNSEWGGPYFYVDGSDSIASIAGWGGGPSQFWSTGSLWQELSSPFSSNTVYTLTVIWRNDPNTNEALADNVTLRFWDTTVSSNWVVFAQSSASNYLDRTWNTTTLIFDTAAGTNASIVGKPVGASFDLTTETGTWVHIDRIELTANPYGPVITKQPASRTVYVNVAPTFSVDVLATPEPTVQWYEVDGGTTNLIAGATNLSYTTPPATLGMDGNVYFAEASSTLGTVSTDAATLSVETASEGSDEIFSVQLGGVGVEDWQPLGAAEMTGAFPMTNWNAVSVIPSGVEQAFPLNDAYGIGSDVGLIIRGAADADSFEDALTSPTAMDKMMNTFISTWWRAEAGSNGLGEGMMELVLTNLNDAETYNIYVYLADPVRNDPAAGGRAADITAGNGVTNYTGTLPTSLPSAFIASTNQSPSGTRDAGNYVHLTGISPAGGTITVTVNYYDPPWEGWGAGVAGVQVVNESRDLFGPIFDTQPTDQSVITNTSAIITAGVLGSPFPTMQWYEIDGSTTNLIGGATGQTYTTPPVTEATSGRGYFMIASGLTSVTSDVAYVTGLFLAYPALGWLQVDQYYVTNSTVSDVLNPVWQAANMPSKTHWIDTLDNPHGMPDNSTERIYGFFTPQVTSNYVFFVSSDDEALLLLSTDDDPANRCQIAYEEFWSADGTSWTNSGGGSLVSQKRSDQFSWVPFLPGAPWPTGNTISLTAGQSYYIEVGHRQGGGGQSAAVTYTFAGAPLPTNGTQTVIAAKEISTYSAREDILAVPVIAMDMAASDLILHGSEGIPNGRYDVVSSDDLSVPSGSWSVEETGFLDASGTFTSTNTPADTAGFYRMRLLP